MQQQQTREQICIQLSSDPCPPEAIVKSLASIEGPVDVYCWYEGPQGLPRSGASFMKESIFEPLFALKKDAHLCLYSLKFWDLKKSVTKMSTFTPLGEAINRINRAAIECIYSSSFFRYCMQFSKENALYNFINEELPKKEWLIELSAHHRKNGTKIAALFDNQSSLFDCIKDLDVCAAYSLMQYVEGYYLIRESVEKGLLKGQKKIEIAFILPNDEGKYYQDFPKDIEKMLRLDFGKSLMNIEVNIAFQCFQYGKSLTSRPYIDKTNQAQKVGEKEISSYFDYLSKQQLSQSPPKMPFLKDVIHDINGWERT